MTIIVVVIILEVVITLTLRHRMDGSLEKRMAIIRAIIIQVQVISIIVTIMRDTMIQEDNGNLSALPPPEQVRVTLPLDIQNQL